MGSGNRSLWEDLVPRVDPQRCRRCADCPPLAACLMQGFRREDPAGLPSVAQDCCLGCYACVGACPYGAIMPPKVPGR